MRFPLKKIIGSAVAGVILFFMVRSLVSGLAELENVELKVIPWRLAASFCVLAVLFPAYGRIWQHILAKLGYFVGFGESMRIWFLSQAGRYIPGKVWFALGRIYLCERAGIPRAVATVAMGLELALVLGSAVIVFGVAAALSPSLAQREYMFGLLIVPLIVACVHPRVIKAILRRFKRLPADFDMSYPDVLRILGLYVLCWCVYGTGFYLVATSFWVTDAPPDFFSSQARVIPEMIGINSLSWSGGLLSIITPAGLGVREGIAGGLLSRVVGSPYPSLIPLVARIWITIAEAGTIGIVFFLRGAR
jgi:uncharacterized membrane protein YbhN (UPF0104 family)